MSAKPATLVVAPGIDALALVVAMTDRETYKAKTPPHDPRMGIYRWDESTWPEN